MRTAAIRAGHRKNFDRLRFSYYPSKQQPAGDATAICARGPRDGGGRDARGRRAGDRARYGGAILVFDPARVTDGIELGDDPLPLFRSQAYSVSAQRRSGASRPAELA